MRFLYNCPECGEEMEGSFGDNVHCNHCDIWYATDWDYINGDSMAAWITGKIKRP